MEDWAIDWAVQFYVGKNNGLHVDKKKEEGDLDLKGWSSGAYKFSTYEASF